MIGLILTIGTGAILYKYSNLLQNSIIYAAIYKLIYVFSYLQIKCNKLSNIVSDLIKNINPFITITIAKEGDKICNAFISNKEYKYYKNGKQLLDNSNSEIDLAIVKDNKNGLTLLLNGIEEVVVKEESDEPCIEESKVTFISVAMNYNGEKYKINLKTPEYNFYVVGNKIDKAFLQYYLVNILQLELDKNKDKNKDKDKDKDKDLDTKFEYFLEIMDNDVNFVFLNERQYILLKEDKYLLLQV